jgi:hypothetical protein
MSVYLRNMSLEDLQAEIERRRLEKEAAEKDPKPKRPSAPKKPMLRVPQSSTRICVGREFTVTLASFRQLIDQHFPGTDYETATLTMEAFVTDDYYGDADIDATISVVPDAAIVARAEQEYNEKLAAYEQAKLLYQERYQKWKKDVKEWEQRNSYCVVCKRMHIDRAFCTRPRNRM